MKHAVQSPAAKAAWALSLALVVPAAALAQYGGQPSGDLFAPPKDVRAAGKQFGEIKLARPDRIARNHDPYDPEVWQADQTNRGRSGSRVAGPQLADHRVAEPEIVPAEPGVDYELGPHEIYPDEYGPPQGDCHGCGDCDSCGGGDWSFPIVPYHAQMFGGVHGFKSPIDAAQLGTPNGNFGFREGFNVSGPLSLVECFDIGYQFGWQAVHSNHSGTVENGDDARDQYFMTAGLFNQQKVGLEWGIVWDWLHDEFVEEVDFHQIRGQVDVINYHGCRVGAMVSVGTGRDSLANGARFETTDQYLFFYGWTFDGGGSGRLWGGFTGSKDGMFGGDAAIPLSDRWSLELGANYLIPEEGGGPRGAQNEAWNLGINLVWHWSCDAHSVGCSPYRPMFNVADNGSLMIER